MVVVFGNRCDNKNHFELVDPNDHSKFECRPVPTCQEGQEPSLKPGSVHPKATDVSCIPCGHGWFSNHDTNFRCQKCTSCGNKDVRLNCSIYRDAVCSKSCKSKTHYFNETDGQCYTSLRGRRLKGKRKGVLGSRETRGGREEGGRETPARRPLFFSFLTSTRRMLKS